MPREISGISSVGQRGCAVGEPRPKIYVERVGKKFAVRVEPEQPARDWNASFDDHRGARGFASGVRLVTSFPIIDMASDAALGDMLSLPEKGRRA